ncbi:MFS transporter [Tessaracoccus sp. HDW20]|uniref:MFS transporter n=1 Tax=Tessaracoccus coleopterorum TaxID=2714950 RepID=UPI0018D32D49|nr:MFS transporter [Tessaracoccus coleopterorum]NHB84559.1 MFS transporter [Tessaracoccus coleopterorum]
MLQVLAFGLVTPASVYYINRHFPPHQRVTGQAFMTMTATGGSVVGSVAGGIVLDVSGVPLMLLVGLVAATLGAVFMAIGADRS